MTIHPLWGNIVGVLIVLTMASFLGIWIWVWNRRHKDKYDALARMPMEDDLIQDDLIQDNVIPAELIQAKETQP